MASTGVALALAIFLFTYCFLAFEKLPLLKLDRTGGVLVGAVMMVATGILTFEEAWTAIDGQTIVLLTGMMILNVYLEASGFFSLVADVVLKRFRSPVTLLIGLTFLSGILSALFLNDTVCLMLTVPLLRALTAARLPTLPYIVALAMSANVGSVMTVTGNPQNMLIHVYSEIGYLPFALRLVPVGLASLAVLVVVLLLFFGRSLGKHVISKDAETAALCSDYEVDYWLLGLTLLTLAGVLAGFMVSPNLALVAITGAAALLVLARRPAQTILAQVDWVLLVFFSGLFVVMAGVAKTGLLEKLAAQVQPIYGNSLTTQVPVFCSLTVIASNVVSNVPFVILARDMMATLIDPKLMWLMLAMASTFAGNLTIPGSVATLIVLRLAGPEHRVGFFQFLLVGVPVTLLTTALGAAMLLWLGAAS
ncbi:Inner membrane protein YbiR [Planctomycetes bacterium Pan216]|uniref:Inner membrane protein YbiR n=1 Tax=Kolteria novifilia TaxID=2527975 RepID=A0A518B3U4_9BACT|nr:Inner membrane protein YbiR [Planctomycetes bacterium Pan216]